MFWKVMAIAVFFLLCMFFGVLTRLADGLEKDKKALELLLYKIILEGLENKRRQSGIMPYKDPL